MVKCSTSSSVSTRLPARLLGLPPEGGHRGARRRRRTERQEAAAQRAAPARAGAAFVAGVALLPGVYFWRSTRQRAGVKPSPGLYFQKAPRPAGATCELGQRVRGGGHQRLEHEHDVAHHEHLRVVVRQFPRLAGEVERQLLVLHGEAHLQTHLAQQSLFAVAEARAALPPEHQVRVTHRLAHAVEVVQRLRQPRRALGTVEPEVLRLHREGAHLEPERLHGAVRGAGVVLAEHGRVVAHAPAHDRVRHGRQARHRQQPRRVERARRRGLSVVLLKCASSSRRHRSSSACVS